MSQRPIIKISRVDTLKGKKVDKVKFILKKRFKEIGSQVYKVADCTQGNYYVSKPFNISTPIGILPEVLFIGEDGTTLASKKGAFAHKPINITGYAEYDESKRVSSILVHWTQIKDASYYEIYREGKLGKSKITNVPNNNKKGMITFEDTELKELGDRAKYILKSSRSSNLINYHVRAVFEDPVNGTKSNSGYFTCPMKKPELPIIKEARILVLGQSQDFYNNEIWYKGQDAVIEILGDNLDKVHHVVGIRISDEKSFTKSVKMYGKWIGRSIMNRAFKDMPVGESIKVNEEFNFGYNKNITMAQGLHYLETQHLTSEYSQFDRKEIITDKSRNIQGRWLDRPMYQNKNKIYIYIPHDLNIQPGGYRIDLRTEGNHGGIGMAYIKVIREAGKTEITTKASPYHVEEGIVNHIQFKSKNLYKLTERHKSLKEYIPKKGVVLTSALLGAVIGRTTVHLAPLVYNYIKDKGLWNIIKSVSSKILPEAIGAAFFAWQTNKRFNPNELSQRIKEYDHLIKLLNHKEKNPADNIFIITEEAIHDFVIEANQAIHDIVPFLLNRFAIELAHTNPNMDIDELSHQLESLAPRLEFLAQRNLQELSEILRRSNYLIAPSLFKLNPSDNHGEVATLMAAVTLYPDSNKFTEKVDLFITPSANPGSYLNLKIINPVTDKEFVKKNRLVRVIPSRIGNYSENIGAGDLNPMPPDDFIANLDPDDRDYVEVA